MREVTTKVYSIYELKPLSKLKALEEIRDFIKTNYLDSYIEEELSDYLHYKSKLEDVYIDFGIYQNFNNFAYFTAENVVRFDIIYNQDLEKANVFEKYILKHYDYKSQTMQMLVEFLSANYTINVSKNVCCDYGVEAEYVQEENEVLNFEINDYMEDLEQELTEVVYKPLCADLLRLGHEVVEKELSDTTILDYCEENNIEFLENGRTF